MTSAIEETCTEYFAIRGIFPNEGIRQIGHLLGLVGSEEVVEMYNLLTGYHAKIDRIMRSS